MFPREKGGRHSELRLSIAHMENSDSKMLMEPGWEAGVGVSRGSDDGGCSTA